jgi:hypothetical protein
VKKYPLAELHTVCNLAHFQFIFFYIVRKKSSSHKCISEHSFGGRVEEGEVEAVDDGVLFFYVFCEGKGDEDVGGAFYCEAVRGSPI